MGKGEYVYWGWGCQSILILENSMALPFITLKWGGKDILYEQPTPFWVLFLRHLHSISPSIIQNSPEIKIKSEYVGWWML